ncbi:hypothetical protein [Maribacter sp. LLG6340-A2]|uniref:hypothetical protein n=1 Tax=Maribacter sp. LLG6340-A2 TaxID=3160834 RepID=UPI00386B6141
MVVSLKPLFIFLIFFTIIFTTSCRKDFEYSPSAGNLSFSKDTVYLDTVFANIGSSTYKLKVYNNSKNDILIPQISLRNGNESFYRLNVDGVAGKSFESIPLYAQDSLFIFIETTIDITDNSTEIIYTDAILFDQAPHQQSVELITLAKDAIFIYPDYKTGSNSNQLTLYTNQDGSNVIVDGFELNVDDLNFTNTKPYVIYGYAIVPESKELQIDAGARVYFHNNSGLVVSENARLTVNGKLSEDKDNLEGEVIFEGDRLEPNFETMPGQWGAVWISQGSTNNLMDYLTIKNAQIGLFVEGNSNQNIPTLTIRNSQIFNNTQHNIWAKHANLLAENLVLGNSGSTSLRIEHGGTYSFTHSTIANYWNKGFRSQPAITITNGSLDDTGIEHNLEQLSFRNSIIDGNSSYELEFNPSSNQLFNFNFDHCFIKYFQDQIPNENQELYIFSNTEYYNTIYTDVKLDYFSASNNDYRIGLESKLINLGEPNVANEIPFDLLGTSRIAGADLGAYQAKEKETVNK